MPAATSTSTTAVVDANALKTNQILIVFFVIAGFILGMDHGGPWIVLLVGLALAIGAVRPGYGPFQLLYRNVLLSSGRIKRNPVPGSPSPHRFAQAMGSVFLFVAALFLFAGISSVGWWLAWLVVALALANLFFGFCAGCFVFFQLQRAGLFS